MKITRVLTYAINKLWLTIAVLLVAAAILLSLARVALPYADRYKTEIEDIVLAQYGQPIDIGELSATWTLNGPALLLKDVTLVNQETDRISFVLGETRAQLNFWDSLLGWQIIFDDFELVRIELDIHNQGSQELPSLPLLEAIERLLFEQLAQFRVEESVIRLHHPEHDVRVISIQDLSWLNRNGRRQGVGRFNIPDVTANYLDFIIDLNSNVGEPLAGSLYVEASHLDISPWISQLTQTAELKRAEFNLRGWLDFADGQFTQGQVHFDENRLEWTRNGSEHVLTTSPTTWSLTPNVNGWLMNSAPMFIRLDNDHWPVDTVAWEYHLGTHTWNVSDLEIPNASPVWGLFGSPSADLSAWSEGIQPKGDIQDIKVRLTQNQEWQFYLRADNLSWQPYRGIPGVSGLNFEFWSNRNQGGFEITGEEVSLHSPSTFSTSQLLQRLSWEGFWSRDQQGWTVRLPNASFELPDATIIQRLRLEGGADRSPHVEWLVESGQESLSTLDGLGLLPLQLGDGVSHYLQGAMRSGVVENLKMVWRGALSDFPYRGGEGVFQARAGLQELEFRFAQDWPTLRAPNARIHYQDEVLAISSDAAQLADVNLRDVSANINGLLEQDRKLDISASVTAMPEPIQQLFAQSPLASTAGAAMEIVVGSAEVSGGFDLSIPLADPMDATVSGFADIPSQAVYIQPIDTTFSNVSGRLSFTKDTLSFSANRVRWQGLPLNISVTGENIEDVYQVTINGESLWSAEQIAASLERTSLVDFVNGEVRSGGEFVLNIREGELDYQGLFRSDFTPASSTLPEPFKKAPGEIWFWETSISGDLDSLELKSGVADQFYLYTRKNIEEPGFQAAEIQLGETGEQVNYVENASRLRANLKSIDVSAWQALHELGRNTTSSGDEAMPNFFPPLQFIDLNAATLNIAGHVFHDVRADLELGDLSWLGRIDAEETRIEVDYAEHNGSMRMTADFLELTQNNRPEISLENEGRGIEEQSISLSSNWLSSLPPFEFICRICRYNNKDFGRITLGFDPRVEDGQLRHLRLLKSGAQLELTGGWTETDGQVYSNIQGNFGTSNISQLLQEWDFDSVVRDASTEVITDLLWEGGLLDFNVETLDGTLRYSMESGYLRDVDDGGARLFSVLSLDSLVRKLSLDFRDIFARGMFFNKFAGDVQIVDGVFETSNSTMLGSAGDLEVQGSTNWSTQVIDYKLSYTPKVTSSLPVLLAWMVNPPSGIAALLLDRVLHDAKVISRLEYRMTGTVQEPVVSEVRRDATDVEIPEEAIQEFEEQQGIESEPEGSDQEEPESETEPTEEGGGNG